MPEPTVLDYVKEKLHFWKKGELHIPTPEEMALEQPIYSDSDLINRDEISTSSKSDQISFAIFRNFPYRSASALLLAFIAQISLEPPVDNARWSFMVYLLSFALAIWAFLSREWQLTDFPEETSVETPFAIRGRYLLVLGPLAILVYLLFGKFTSRLGFTLFGSYQFKFLNTVLWLAAITLVVLAFIQPGRSFKECGKSCWTWLISWPKNIRIKPYTLLSLLVIAIILFFRFFRITSVPSEMTSDHVEKLLDVEDVLNGFTNVFFARNTGREAFQFYLTAGIIKLFHTGISFISLKLGTVLAGLGALPFIYLLGKELANRRVALLAVLLAGIAYWPNVISRVGLRFPLYPLFAAPALYFFVRGIRHKNRNDFIWAGISVGIGLHGYSPFRIIPLVLLVGLILYLLTKRTRQEKTFVVLGFVAIGMISFILFLPLLRYAFGNPDIFIYRMFTRMGDLERPLPGPPMTIFVENLWNAMTMFGYKDGLTWLHSIPLRPGMDVVGAALFYLGYILIFMRWLQKRRWEDLFLFLSVPLLMLPSILSLAFPIENPSLNRTAGAIIPVFIIVALALDGFMHSIERALPSATGKFVSTFFAVILVFASIQQNYRLMFVDYPMQFNDSAGNTSELGAVIKQFTDTIGTPDSAWVVGYPYWLDTRLVGLQAGFGLRDLAIWPEQFNSTLEVPGPKLFLLNTEDTEDLERLRIMYPTASVRNYASKTPGKDFIVMLTPPEN